MTFTVDALKGLISSSGGLAVANLYRVYIPVIFNSGNLSSGTTLDLLCKNVSMPGRQILTYERPMGINYEKIAYGYANDDVPMTFIGLNDYSIRRYFNAWQGYMVNAEEGTVRYKTDYITDITIQQLNKAGQPVYSVKLLEAFPTQLLNTDFSNELNGLVDVGATFAYTKWIEV